MKKMTKWKENNQNWYNLNNMWNNEIFSKMKCEKKWKSEEKIFNSEIKWK